MSNANTNEQHNDSTDIVKDDELSTDELHTVAGGVWRVPMQHLGKGALWGLRT